MKTVQWFLKKLKIEIAHEPVILLLGMYPKELTAGRYRDICAPTFKIALCTIGKRWKQPKHLWTDE